MSLLVCIPNVSDGRRADVVTACAEAIDASGVRLLHIDRDSSHNRSVLTFAGSPDLVAAAAVELFAAALPRIDLREHRGAHPRVGAVDVTPFVPMGETPMAECVALAQTVGRDVAARFDLPVYLYEEAATSPHRRALEDIRRGQFEGLADRMRQTGWAPDFGPTRPHPTAGAAVIGARRPLVAFNVNLATTHLDVAHQIARAVRHSSGGLPFVKALGIDLAERGLVQVSMNLTNVDKTPIAVVFDLVAREAARHGVAIEDSEIVGLVPSAAMTAAAAHYLRLPAFGDDRVLERRLASAEPTR